MSESTECSSVDSNEVKRVNRLNVGGWIVWGQSRPGELERVKRTETEAGKPS